MPGRRALGKGGGTFQHATHHALYILVGIKSRVVRQDHVGHGPESCQLRVGDHIPHPIIIVQAVLIFQHIQTGCPHLTAFQGCQQGIAVNELAPGGVDDGNTGLHLGKGSGIQQVVVFLGGVGVEGDNVAFCQLAYGRFFPFR